METGEPEIRRHPGRASVADGACVVVRRQPVVSVTNPERSGEHFGIHAHPTAGGVPFRSVGQDHRDETILPVPTSLFSVNGELS